MTTPTRMVWDLAGRPEPVANVAALITDTAGTCCVCGLPSDHTADTNRALGANFTDRAMFRDPRSSRVCPACLWCCSGKPPATLRMWTIVAVPGYDLAPSHEKCALPAGRGLHLTNRANTAAVSTVLRWPPPGEWVVTVAVSGQKHVLPYGTVNRGCDQWTVRLEATNVTSTPDDFAHVLRTAARLRAAGHRDDDIRRGAPTMSALKADADADHWRGLFHALADHTGHTHSPLLDLALWCITKETIHDHANAA
ncbi:hypothetical protein [Phytoactinopolyspora limicola]|uniref:hypothetical protein n=1 Tax=Phytoactinopolyspora limicola TaxID=2715536 RepID=UPI0014092D0D|nr:hypothetical protein [Phytoactinopolyspora limicola]